MTYYIGQRTRLIANLQPFVRISREWRILHWSRRPVESTQYLSIHYTESLIEANIEASADSTGDSYDNALAETINGLYKTEVIRHRVFWRTTLLKQLNLLLWNVQYKTLVSLVEIVLES